MLQTFGQSFRLENVMITVLVVLPARWQASIRSGEISQRSFPKIFKTFSSRTSPDTSGRISRISRNKIYQHIWLKSWVTTIFSPQIRSKLTYIYLIRYIHMVSVKVVYNMKIVKKNKTYQHLW